MATAETRTNEQILKAINRMSDKVGGNDAQQKKEKEARQKLLKQETILKERMLILLEEQKKERLKEKQTTMSLFSMIRTNATQYFDETKKNQITWGGLFQNFGESVKDWFDAASKQRTILGATLRLGASLWKATHTHIISAVKNVFSKVGSHMREVLGELAEVFDVVMNVFKSAFNFLKDSLFGFMARVPPADRKRNKMLQFIVNYFRRQEKLELIKLGKSTKVDNWLLAGLALVTAGIIGGIIRKYLLPFEIAFKALRIGKAFGWIGKFFMKFALVGKMLAPFVGAGGMWDKIIKYSLKLGALFPKFAAGLKLMGWAFKIGFKFFGWPLQILLAAYDFITGFNAAPGDFRNKMKGGLKKMVMGFLELPIKILAWLYEQFTGQTTSGDKWVKEFEEGIDPLLNFASTFLTGGGFFESLLKMMEGFDEIQREKIKPIMDFIKSIKDFPLPVMPMFGSGGPAPKTIDQMSNKDAEFQKKVDQTWHDWTFGLLGTDRSSTIDKVSQAEADKKSAEAEGNTKQITTAIKKQTKESLEGQKKIAEDNQANTQVAVQTGTTGGGGSYEIPQLPEGVGSMGFNENDF